MVCSNWLFDWYIKLLFSMAWETAPGAILTARYPSTAAQAATHCVCGPAEGHHGGGQHCEAGGEASERPAVQQGGQCPVPGEAEAAAAGCHAGAGGGDHHPQRDALQAGQNRRPGTAETQVITDKCLLKM